MRKTRIIILTLALTLCLILTAGCTSTTNPGTSADSGTCPAPVVSVKPAPAPIMSTPVQYKEVNGVKLGYREFGSGEPILLLEGFGSTIDNWNATFVGILASKYHVYTYDHRGMGYSSTNNATPTISLYADDAAGFIKALGYDSMNAYGVSMGSTTLGQLAIDHPERVRKIVMSSSTYNPRIPECKVLLTILTAESVNPNTTAGVRDEANANLAWNGSWSGLSGINKDVMFIVGTDDLVTPDSVSLQMAGQVNGSWVVRFKGIPHEGEKYAPNQYGQSILNFLAMIEAPATSK